MSSGTIYIKKPTSPCPQARLDLPGLNFPLNWTPHEKYHQLQIDTKPTTFFDFAAQGSGNDLYPTALDTVRLSDGYCSMPLTTVREFTMLHLMNSITDKPGWEEKVFNDEIVQKLKTEAMASEHVVVTQAMVDFVFAELQWRSVEFKKTGAIYVYNGDVMKSDTAIPLDVKLSLQKAVKALEDIPKIYKDYHPGSNNQVLDLVHPSLFPLTYGRSRALRNREIGLHDAIKSIGEGTILEIRPDEERYLDTKGSLVFRNSERQTPYSKNFQWLPADVDISTGEAKITSYINNLHPEHHQDLYEIINQIITKSIPLWSMTLAGIESDEGSLRIKYSLSFDPDPEDMTDEDKPPRRDDEDEDDYNERIWEWGETVRKVVPCDPGAFEPLNRPVYGGSTVVDIFKDFADSGLQVIVKLANIELTPEKPTYSGGSWHVEGQLNEHICATALYYYDNENISDSYLSFRQQVSSHDFDDISYPQGVHDWLPEIFGVEQYGPTVQEVGNVLCKEGRLLTFPNILQHRVDPFELTDPTKPGHRKIVALFLVDPGIRIVGTANVPPQQKEWWSERVREEFAGKEEALGKLSNELKEKVFQNVDDFPIGMDEAKELRLLLMEERKAKAVDDAEHFVSSTFSLCEH